MPSPDPPDVLLNHEIGPVHAPTTGKLIRVKAGSPAEIKAHLDGLATHSRFYVYVAQDDIIITPKQYLERMKERKEQ